MKRSSSVGILSTVVLMASGFAPGTTATASDGAIASDEGLPSSLSVQVANIQNGGLLPNLNHFEWIDETQSLVAHVTGPSAGADVLLSRLLPSTPNLKVVNDLYAASQLADESQRLATELMARGLAVASAGPTVENDAIEIRVVLPKGATVDTIRVKSAYPVLIKSAPGLAVSSVSRSVDSAPYAGGGVISYPNGSGYNSCTSGFSVRLSSGAQGMLTANHCGSSGQVWRRGLGGNGPVFGTGSTVTTGTDIRLITGTTYRGRIFVGTNTSTTDRAVTGKTSPIVGDSLCYSGAYSGLLCGNTITALNQYVCYSGAGCYGGLALTQSGGSQLAAAGDGDSGGPVYKAGSGITLAVGLVSGRPAGYDKPCRGVPTSPTRTCSSAGYIAPVQGFFSNNAGWIITTSAQ